MIIFERDKFDRERTIELSARLFESRTIWLTGHITPFNAEQVVMQMQVLDMQGNATIRWFLNSMGGSVSDGLMLYDLMNTIRSKTDIICAGQCSSMAAVLLSSATGTRYAYANSYVMVHKVSAGTIGKVQDMEISLEHTQLLNDRLMHILARNTGKSVEQIYADTDRDNFMTAEQAREYGLIDVIL